MKIDILTFDTHAILKVDAETQAALQRIREEETEEWGTIKMETEVMESTFCNSEWDWVCPQETGDMTDAPMFGIREESVSDLGSVIERYAFMSYALRSFLDDLADTGESRWEGGK
jgi:hypothetical protein